MRTEQQAKRILNNLGEIQRLGYHGGLCPRCGIRVMAPDLPHNSLSHFADVYICSSCGMEESLGAAARQEMLPYRAWAIFDHAENEPDNRGEQLLSYVCDNICRFREKAQTQDEMDEFCEKCHIEEAMGVITPASRTPCRPTEDLGYQSVDILVGEQLASLSPHDYVETEVIEGCTVQTLRCRRCGHESFAWHRKKPALAADKRTTFVNADPGLRDNSRTKAVYALGLKLDRSCPQNDCHIYRNIFNMARELDGALDIIEGYPATVLQRQLCVRIRELEEMYRENHAIKAYRVQSGETGQPEQG